MNKNFLMIFITVLVAMTSIATFNPILGLLARNLGFTEIQTGSLVTITGLFWIIGSFLWGNWARTKRKRVMVIAITGYLLTLASFAYLSDQAQLVAVNPIVLYWQLFFLRAVGGFFFGAIPTMAQGYLMEWTTAQNRASGMALFGGASGMGFVLGPALGAALTSVGFTAPMYASAALLAVVAICFAMIIPPQQKQREKASGGKLSATDPRISLYVAIGLLLSTVMIILQVTCGIYMQDQLSLAAIDAATMIGVGLSVAGVIVVVVQLMVGRYLRWKPARLLKLGLTSLFAAFALFLLAPSLYLLVFVLFGIGIGFTLPGYITAASLAVQAEEQSTVATYTAAAQGVGSFIGPLTGTLLYSLHLSIPYVVCAVLLFLFCLRVFTKRRVEAVVANS
ncbi:MFS transporter [Brevibacillus reuszeri]|uniref:MFS transporter n=1 Tax=Brevibacillus reuszeri TaxID=54915 RepID=A0A0K9YQ39_9BACL|nr:MFS transporter [Brevibacillus reuszeri]KNB70833.1 major facilitator transporter [Brevibacillus reuszeri]MED1857220.1 MFS transporter [Brevibacillus reuszeri]GED66954.1 MFS transporter [Brevibacillus reuszeri]